MSCPILSVSSLTYDFCLQYCVRSCVNPACSSFPFGSLYSIYLFSFLVCHCEALLKKLKKKIRKKYWKMHSGKSLQVKIKKLSFSVKIRFPKIEKLNSVYINFNRECTSFRVTRKAQKIILHLKYKRSSPLNWQCTFTYSA